MSAFMTFGTASPRSPYRAATASGSSARCSGIVTASHGRHGISAIVLGSGFGRGRLAGGLWAAEPFRAVLLAAVRRNSQAL